MDFKKVPTILSAEELTDMAFRRASKLSVPPSRFRVKRLEERKVKVVTQAVRGNLSKVLNRFPDLDRLTPFYFELIDALVDIPRLKRALKALHWTINKFTRMEKEYTYKIRISRKEEDIYRYRKEFYGRVASILKQVDGQFEYLAMARERLKKLPNVEDVFTVVVSGAPNVGKSTFIRAVTTARPRVESYPFTTTQILLGYLEVRHKRYQFVDTPGLLDREFRNRNPVERQAVLALKHLADVVLFLFDLSSTCGFPVDEQMNIYREIRESFDVPVVPVVNKADLLEGDEIGGFLKDAGGRVYVCSARERWGLEELIGDILG